MKITNMNVLKQISKELEKLQTSSMDCIEMDDNELNSDVDIYNAIGNVIEQIEEMLEV